MRRPTRALALFAMTALALGIWSAPSALGRAASSHAPVARPASGSPTPVSKAHATAVPSVARHATAPSRSSALYYRDNDTIYAAALDGSGPVPLASIPAASTFQPTLLADGSVLYQSATGFATVDSSGSRRPLASPSLGGGESVWSASGSPDGHSLAWQLFTPSQVNNTLLHEGSSRIVTTGPRGGGGTLVLQDAADGTTAGSILSLLGWRPSSPVGSGGSTLMLQNLYSLPDVSASLAPGTTRGLIEYDPSLHDIVDDYLPPTTSNWPAQRAFSISKDGLWAVYGDGETFTPSGDGPLARGIEVLNLDTSQLVRLDSSSRYAGSMTVIMKRTHGAGGRKTTVAVPVTIRLYQYFSHDAYVAPDDNHILYTKLTVSYPPGAHVPRVDRQALVATRGGQNAMIIDTNGQGEGWLNGHVVVTKRSDGLYAVDITSGNATLLIAGSQATLIGAQ